MNRHEKIGMLKDNEAKIVGLEFALSSALRDLVNGSQIDTGNALKKLEAVREILPSLESVLILLQLEQQKNSSSKDKKE